MNDFVQVMILLMSAATAYFLCHKQGSVRRWGYVVGFLSEPFWLYAAWAAGQWAVVLLVFWWAGNYIRGALNNWRVE